MPIHEDGADATRREIDKPCRHAAVMNVDGFDAATPVPVWATRSALPVASSAHCPAKSEQQAGQESLTGVQWR
jgi:hypothetical protein